MKPSDRQQAIFDNWANENNNIVVKAVAGSGKTTTLMQLLERSKTKTLFVAFNKSIQTEIQDRIEAKKMDSYAKAMTMHSLGLSAIKRNYKFNIKSGKGFGLMKKVENSEKELYRRLKWQEKAFISQTILAMNDVSRMFLTNDFKKIIGNLSDMSINYTSLIELPELWDKFVKYRERSYEFSTIDIDFADMIYLPIVKNLRIPVKPTHLMIDEAQDLNLAQHTLIEKVINQGTVKKWIAVGDPNQSIYGFTGAYAKSFDKFLEKDNTIEFPLDICYRCPANIVDKANEVYDVMEAFKKEDGIISYKEFDDIDLIPDEALIICRNTQPLIGLFFDLLSKDRKVYLKGEDMLGELKKFLFPYMRNSLRDAYEEMLKRAEKMHYISENSKNPLDKHKYKVFMANLENFVKIIGYFQDRLDTVSQVISFLQKLFADDDTKGITLCTIHKSKGLEADVVYILNEFLIPSSMAKSPEMERQEENLRYVARTRSKKELHFLTIKTK